MKERCNNPNCKDFKNYGAKGIKVCALWSSYDLFVKQMGVKPTMGHTIERKKNSLGYFKENCVWATRKEQARNKQNSPGIRQSASGIQGISWDVRRKKWKVSIKRNGKKIQVGRFHELCIAEQALKNATELQQPKG